MGIVQSIHSVGKSNSCIHFFWSLKYLISGIKVSVILVSISSQHISKGGFHYFPWDSNICLGMIIVSLWYTNIYQREVRFVWHFPLPVKNCDKCMCNYRDYYCFCNIVIVQTWHNYIFYINNYDLWSLQNN